MNGPINIALVGMGTVGLGVVAVLARHPERVSRCVGRNVFLKHVIVRDTQKPREVKLAQGVLSSHIERAWEDDEVDIVVELMGGIEPARTLVLNSLSRGKDIVTANKALLAEHGGELFAAARRAGRAIGFEAAVAGGVPIIAGIGQSLAANQWQSISGILNGTSNYIVTQMTQNGTPYQEALCEAQRLGYAESNPTMDVDGTDAAQKLALLVQLAYGASVPWQQIPRRGVDSMQQVDLRYASELGYRIKLLAIAQATSQESGPDCLDLSVSPTLVRSGTPLAEVRGAFNAISVVGDIVGPVFFQGLGAGRNPTSSAVIADIIDTALGRGRLTFNALNLWSEARVPLAVARAPGEASGRFYIRMRVDDHSGVLAEVSGVFSTLDISIASVIQHEPTSDDDAAGVDLVIMTHQTTCGAMQTAMIELAKLACVQGVPTQMRVLDYS